LKLSDHGLEMLHEIAGMHFQISKSETSTPLASRNGL